MTYGGIFQGEDSLHIFVCLYSFLSILNEQSFYFYLRFFVIQVLHFATFQVGIVTDYKQLGWAQQFVSSTKNAQQWNEMKDDFIMFCGKD